jgi:Pentapeptide repeats (8 copies)
LRSLQYQRNFNDRYGPLAFVIGEPAKGLDLRGADLRHSDLSRLPLAQVRCGLRSADWYGSTVEQREAAATHLEGADLRKSNLTSAVLRSAHLERADLKYAHLEGTHLQGAHLEGSDLRNVSFNHETNLEEIVLANEVYGCAQIVDINWSGVNLAVINWSNVEMIGDEREARRSKADGGRMKSKKKQFDDHKVAVRANRQLSVILQAQGLNEEAARFAYHAQKLQSVILRRQKKISQYLFFLFLWLLAGYGYKPVRSVACYLGIVIGFTVAYSILGHLPFIPDALVFSLTSFHGRGFFPGLESKASLHNPLVVLAAFEAVIGLFIEISFIATFTQRYFGR